MVLKYRIAYLLVWAYGKLQFFKSGIINSNEILK